MMLRFDLLYKIMTFYVSCVIIEPCYVLFLEERSIFFHEVSEKQYKQFVFLYTYIYIYIYLFLFT